MTELLDQLRDLIVDRDSPLPPESILTLSGAYDRLRYLELVHDCVKLEELQDKHRIRNTRKGEWPEEGQRVHYWDGDEWWSWQYGRESEAFDGLWATDCQRLWLPAPPPPNKD